MRTELAVKSLVAQKSVSLAKWLYREIAVKLSGGTVSHQGFLEYILALGKIYQGSNRVRRGQLLRDAQEITGKSERTVLRHLSVKPETIQKRIEEKKPIASGRGRKKKYDEAELLPHAKALWIHMERICSIRMKEGLNEWLKFYTPDSLTDAQRMQLQTISRGTLERLLASIRNSEKADSGISTTSPARCKIKNLVPLNRYDQVITRPGFTQADTVAHCGTSAAGPFLNTITLTDIFSGWTLNHAIEGKKIPQVRKGFIQFKSELPFTLLGVNTDSGSEFINSPMIEFMSTDFGEKPISFTRSRPYKKNDNCYVEQRNFTHVRSLFGYSRFESPELLPLMNEIYEHYWNPLHNFFLPSQKLLEKVRVGAKIVKKHDKPKTPYDRLMNSSDLSAEQKEALTAKKAQLNPIKLSIGLEQKLKEFFELARKLEATRSTPAVLVSAENIETQKQEPNNMPRGIEFRLDNQNTTTNRGPEFLLKDNKKGLRTRKVKAA